MKRRDFFELGGAMAAMAALNPSVSFAQQASRPSSAPLVDFINDGRRLGPREYAALLMRLADEGRITPDYYSNGGIVEALEQRFAQLLGHEAAVFLPTGTLANHLAVRRLAGSRRRVIVPAESHLYRDSGDCAQTLSQLNLVPLAAGRVCFNVEELTQAVHESAEGRVPTPIGAMLIETPVRRLDDRIVPDAELRELLDVARKHDIHTHLDGARLFIQSVHTGTSPADYGRQFDTVYTSLWKCFNAPWGAVLAGPAKVLEGLAHERRMFGGGLPYAWPAAAVALHFADSFMNEYRSALTRARQLLTSLSTKGVIRFSELENGTHVVRMSLADADVVRFRQALASRSVLLPPPTGKEFFLRINPTLNDVDDLEARFTDALREAATS